MIFNLHLHHHHGEECRRRALKLHLLNPPPCVELILECMKWHYIIIRAHMLLKKLSWKTQPRLSYVNCVWTSFNLPKKVNLLLQELESGRQWQIIIEVITTLSVREILTSPRFLLNSLKCLHMVLPVRKLFSLSNLLKLKKRLDTNQFQDDKLSGKQLQPMKRKRLQKNHDRVDSRRSNTWGISPMR